MERAHNQMKKKKKIPRSVALEIVLLEAIITFTGRLKNLEDSCFYHIFSYIY